MRYLIDTQALLWFIDGDGRLPREHRSSLENRDNQIFVSLASVWEIGIKNAIGKLRVKGDLGEFVKTEIEDYDFHLMGIQLSHIIEATSLPLHHRDPFDRLLIAQGKIENIPIISSDAAFDSYGIKRVW